jgi:hypothetical protein
MIERIIFEYLKNSVELILRRPEILEKIFRNKHGLSEPEIAKILETFKAQTPTVVHSFARDDTKFPAWSVVLAAETEEQEFLGNAAGIDILGQDGEETTSIARANFQVITYTKHPDVTLWYYHIAKAIFKSQRNQFMADAGLTGVTFGASDLAPDKLYLPTFLFARQLTLSAQYEDYYEVPEQTLRPVRVRGIQVDSSGSPGDPGVPTNVMPYGEDDE